jgi:hypothetical protein
MKMASLGAMELPTALALLLGGAMAQRSDEGNEGSATVKSYHQTRSDTNSPGTVDKGPYNSNSSTGRSAETEKDSH